MLHILIVGLCCYRLVEQSAIPDLLRLETWERENMAIPGKNKGFQPTISLPLSKVRRNVCVCLVRAPGRRSFTAGKYNVSYVRLL